MNLVDQLMPIAEDWKFRKPNGSAERIIKDRELWFAGPEYFNDPFDCQADIQATFEAIRQSLVLHHQGDVAGLVDGARSHVETHRYAYFCACGSWAETLMWSHYADSHRGVALGFSFSADSPFGLRELTFKEIQYGSDLLRNAIKRSNDALNMHRAYPSRYPGLMAGEAEQFFDVFRSNIVELFEAARFMKAECWHYERERRYEVELAPEQVAGVARPFAPTDLKHVIFGMACPRDTFRNIQQLLSEPEWEHVQCWQAVRDAVNLKITVEPVRQEV